MRETDRQRMRSKQRQTDRQAGRQTDRHTCPLTATKNNSQPNKMNNQPTKGHTLFLELELDGGTFERLVVAVVNGQSQDERGHALFLAFAGNGDLEHCAATKPLY